MKTIKNDGISSVILLFFNAYCDVRSDLPEPFIYLLNELFLIEDEVGKLLAVVHEDEPVINMIVAELIFRTFTDSGESSMNVIKGNIVRLPEIAVIKTELSETDPAELFGGIDAQ